MIRLLLNAYFRTWMIGPLGDVRVNRFSGEVQRKYRRTNRHTKKESVVWVQVDGITLGRASRPRTLPPEKRVWAAQTAL